MPAADAPHDDSSNVMKRDVMCRVCSDFKSWRKKGNGSKASSSSSSSYGDSSNKTSTESVSNSNGKSTDNTSSSSSSSSSSSKSYWPSTCPPDSLMLGRATWTFLHTMAAYFPETPTKNEQKDAYDLMNILSRSYPCKDCAEHLEDHISHQPPITTTQVDFAKWMCDMHNAVNVRLGKPLFDCSIENLNARWRDGPADGSCD